MYNRTLVTVYTLQYSLQQSFGLKVATCAYTGGALTKVGKAVMHSQLLDADDASAMLGDEHIVISHMLQMKKQSVILWYI